MKLQDTIARCGDVPQQVMLKMYRFGGFSGIGECKDIELSVESVIQSLCMNRAGRAMKSVALYMYYHLVPLLCYALIAQSLADVKQAFDQSQTT